jgi:hypothetical protein
MLPSRTHNENRTGRSADQPGRHAAEKETAAAREAARANDEEVLRMMVEPLKEGFDDLSLEYGGLDRRGAVRESLFSNLLDDAHEGLSFVRERNQALEVRVPARRPQGSHDHERKGRMESLRQLGGHMDGPAGGARSVDSDQDPVEHRWSVSSSGLI